MASNIWQALVAWCWWIALAIEGRSQTVATWGFKNSLNSTQPAHNQHKMWMEDYKVDTVVQEYGPCARGSVFLIRCLVTQHLRTQFVLNRPTCSVPGPNWFRIPTCSVCFLPIGHSNLKICEEMWRKVWRAPNCGIKIGRRSRCGWFKEQDRADLVCCPASSCGGGSAVGNQKPCGLWRQCSIMYYLHLLTA